MGDRSGGVKVLRGEGEREMKEWRDEVERGVEWEEIG